MFFWLLIAILIFAAALKHPVVKGFIGESIVKLIIGTTSEKEGKEKFIINNFLIQLENGKTSQTDHILINGNGIFVIETKNYSGRIYGNDTQQEWTQVLNYGKVKNKFYSPVKQNATHIYHIKQLLSPNAPIYSVVVFVKGNTQHIKSNCVYTLRGLFRFIHAKNSTPLSVDEMKSIFAILSQNNKSHEISNFEHVQNIKEAQADIANNICPRCKSALVKRHGKSGEFWGCSNFPKCKFTKKGK